MNEQQLDFRRFELDGWNAVAPAYEGAIGSVGVELAVAVLDAARIRPGLHVLDVACGPGIVAGQALDRGAEVVAVDFSPAMVDIASARHPDLDVRVGFAEELPVDDNSFDVVVSSLGFPHFADHVAFLAEAHRVLRPGGRISFSGWMPPSNNPFFGIIFDAITNHGDLTIPVPEGPNAFQWSEYSVINDVLVSQNFEPSGHAEVPLTLTVSSGVDDVITTLESIVVRTRAVYLAQRADVKDRIKAQIAEHLNPMHFESMWSVPMHAFVCSAHSVAPDSTEPAASDSSG